MDKKTFVEQRLIYVVKALFPRVESLVYHNYDNPNFPMREIVRAEVGPLRETSTGFGVTIDVTADSLIALTRDVLKKLEEKL